MSNPNGQNLSSLPGGMGQELHPPQPMATFQPPPYNSAGVNQSWVQPVIGQPQLPGQFPQPITGQPQSAGQFQNISMQPPVPMNCPSGLEYLAMLDQVLIHQKVELFEAFTGFEIQNKYIIKNSMGQQIFFAKEQSDCCSRQLCGPIRSFEMKIKDNYDNEIIHLIRPLACGSCCFPCCLQKMEVHSPPGNIIGSVNQDWSLCSPVFSVKDSAGETVLHIEGPFCTYSCCGDVEFMVSSVDGEKVGKISKQWSGFALEAFTDADMFGINFPLDMDVKLKAILMGACLLIDFMFFEKSGNQRNDGVGMAS